MSILRLPFWADPNEGRLPMAVKWPRWRQLLGIPPKKKRVNVAKRKIDRARRYS